MKAHEGTDASGGLTLSIPAAGGVTVRTLSPGKRTVVGRDASAGILLDHETVSRRHAEFYRNRLGEWRVRDLRSHNGIRVNGEQVDDEVVHDGDVIEIGGVRLTVGDKPSAYATTISAGPHLNIRDGDTVSIGRLSRPDRPKLEADQLFTVQRLVKRLIEEPDPQQRMILLCRQTLGPPLGAHHAAVVEFPRSGSDSATLVVGPESHGSNTGQTFYLSRSVVEALRTSDEPVLASNCPHRETSATPLTVVSRGDPFAVAACPLSQGAAADGVQRVLYLVLPAMLGSMEWLALAALIAEQYDHAEVAWRGQRAEAEQKVIDRDLQQARRIQLALVPNKIDLPGLDVAISFTPCRTVGGDYVDAFQLPDGRSLLVVADVAGKGMQAALVASSLHTFLHATLAGTGDLGGSITQLNHYMHRTLPDGTFATLIAAVIDPNSGELQYVNAGHPPILIGSSNGQVRELRTGSNLPLGVMESDMQADSDLLGPGECLLLYTDGLTESLNRDGTWLGVEGVARCLTRTLTGHDAQPSADKAAAGLISTVELETTGHDADDRTLLLAARR
jgi:serine phosphatase RsbU (regulator of sigma subunit)